MVTIYLNMRVNWGKFNTTIGHQKLILKPNKLIEQTQNTTEKRTQKLFPDKIVRQVRTPPLHKWLERT